MMDLTVLCEISVNVFKTNFAHTNCNYIKKMMFLFFPVEGVAIDFFSYLFQSNAQLFLREK